MVRVTKRPRKAPRRRLGPAKKPPAKKRKPARRKLTGTSEAVKQLTMYHNPFSTATKQPKIPDGKMGESLGFQTQTVKELICNDAASSGVMTLLMYPGMNSGLIAINEKLGVDTFVSPSNQINVMGYQGSNSMDYSAVAGAASGDIIMNDNYAYWRIVSQGLRLSLLNPAETDDGWWEAARIHVGADPANWKLTGNNLVLDNTAGTMVPATLAQAIASGSVALVNENSYTTGTLRDLKNNLFTLHPIKDDHDFVHPRTTMAMFSTDMTGFDPVDQTVTLDAGHDNGQELVESWNDPSFDMVVIKIHGRTDATNRTRLHANLVSNQEIIFAANEREARFHTTTENTPGFEQHASKLRKNNQSAHNIPP